MTPRPTGSWSSPPVGAAHGLADLLWRPLPSGTSLELTVQRLTQSIRFGVIEAGQRLPSERDLADRLHVGRETVREAIRALRVAGLVRTTRGRTGGTYVTTADATQPDREPSRQTDGLDPETLADLLSYRTVLETGAVVLAASRSLEPEARRLLVDSLEASQGRPGCGTANVRLHLSLAAASGSVRLLGALADVHFQLYPLVSRLLPETSGTLDAQEDPHVQIVDAVLTGDHTQAHRLMAQHCQVHEDQMLGLSPLTE